jgi:Rieske Fe-S protein
MSQQEEGGGDRDRGQSSRRDFLRKDLVLLGGIAALAAGGAGIFLEKNYLLDYLKEIERGLGGGSQNTGQPVIDLATNLVLKTTDVKENQSVNFVYPRTGNPSIDNDTFRQAVMIHLPKGFWAPTNISAIDPISGDTFIAFSRVCVHLWCLCSYDSAKSLISCPCHASEYVPGEGAPYNDPAGSAVSGPASNQPPPNNTLPIITISIASDGTLYATGVVGQIGCGQGCATNNNTATSTPPLSNN